MPAQTEDIAELKRLLAHYDYDAQDPAHEALVEELGRLLHSEELSFDDIARYLREQDLVEGIANTGVQTITAEHARRARHSEAIFGSPERREENKGPQRLNYDKSNGKTPTIFPELMQNWLMDIQKLYGQRHSGIGAAMFIWLMDTGLKEHLTLEDVKALTYGEKAPGEHLSRYLEEEVPSSLCYRPHTRRLAEAARRNHESPEYQVELPDFVLPRYRIHPALVPFKMQLRHWRESCGLTLEEAAERIEIPLPTVTNWEHIGISSMPWDREPRRRLAEAYGVNQALFDWRWYQAMAAAYAGEDRTRFDVSVPEKLRLREGVLSHPEWRVSEAQLAQWLNLPEHPNTAGDFGEALAAWLEITGLSRKGLGENVGIWERHRAYPESAVRRWLGGKDLGVHRRMDSLCHILREAVEAQPEVARAYPFDEAAEEKLRSLADKQLPRENRCRGDRFSSQAGGIAEFGVALDAWRGRMTIPDFLRAVGQKEGKIFVNADYKSWGRGSLKPERLDTICEVFREAGSGDFNEAAEAHLRGLVAASLRAGYDMANGQVHGR